jgi:hypothetical protein
LKNGSGVFSNETADERLSTRVVGGEVYNSGGDRDVGATLLRVKRGTIDDEFPIIAG